MFLHWQTLFCVINPHCIFSNSQIRAWSLLSFPKIAYWLHLSCDWGFVVLAELHRVNLKSCVGGGREDVVLSPASSYNLCKINGIDSPLPLLLVLLISHIWNILSDNKSSTEGYWIQIKAGLSSLCLQPVVRMVDRRYHCVSLCRAGRWGMV